MVDECEKITYALLLRAFINEFMSLFQVVRFAKVVVVAVKPDVVSAILEEIRADLTPDHLIVSIAAGVTIAAMQAV